MTKNNIVRHLTGSENFTEQRKTARLDIPIKVEYKMLDEERGTKKRSDERYIRRGMPALGGGRGETDSEALTIKGGITRLNRAEKDI